MPAHGQHFECPKCKSGKVTVYAKVAKCGNMSCNLTIFRTLCGKHLTDKQVVELITKGKTGVIKGFKSKQKNVFDAILYFDEEFALLKFDFQKQK